MYTGYEEKKSLKGKAFYKISAIKCNLKFQKLSFFTISLNNMYVWYPGSLHQKAKQIKSSKSYISLKICLSNSPFINPFS